ncbi:WhiB family transcriptional regulator [Yimella sp. cx-573]|nr:WhiB family transcriptional regulator [Yimella sp. cx-573]
MFEAIDLQLSTFIDQTQQISQDGTEMPCQANDPEMWFADRPEDVEFAKALCSTCPLQQQCLAGALERQEPWGVWGGELFQSGVVIPRKRPRGRPRKNPVAA